MMSLGQDDLSLESSEEIYDSTAKLLIKTMVFAMRADGRISGDEQQSLREFCNAVFHDQIANIRGEIDRLLTIDLAPERIAKLVKYPEESLDIYLLSAVMLDHNQMLEQGYLEILAASLGIDPSTKRELDRRAHQMVSDDSISA